MGLFKKKEVPAELPSLAVDVVKKAESSRAQQPQPAPTQQSYKPLPKVSAQMQSEQKPDEPVQPQQPQPAPQDEEGYFRNLVKTVTEETDDLDKLSSWYKNKFLPGDMVFQMREYWQKQQPELLLKNISGELKNKLMGKTEKLHSLEKEWQEVYFTLLAKEDEIRKEEKDLKDSLAEFIGLLKRPLSGEGK
ncbi:MAG: hypothetical protein ABIH92_02045 [Nanoarchaeota archaeon]